MSRATSKKLHPLCALGITVIAPGALVLSAGSAQALTCSFAAIASSSCATTTVGNLTFSDFTASGSFEPTDVLNISLNSISGFYDIVGNFTNGAKLSGSGSYGFKVTALSGFDLDKAAVNSDVTLLGTGTFQFLTALPGIPTSPLLSAGGSTALGTFTPGTTTSNVLISWNDQGGTNTANSSSLQLSTNPPSINPVPGPLPIFGAASAFAFSRRLRRRVRTSAS